MDEAARIDAITEARRAMTAEIGRQIVGQNKVIEEMLIVSVVIFLFLLHARSALVPIITLPRVCWAPLCWRPMRACSARRPRA